MARLLYGNSPADFTMSATGRVVSGAELTVWTDRTAGTQVTDLTDIDSVACTVVTSDSAGLVRFYGPDGVDDTLWLDSGVGTRLLVRPVNLPTAGLDIGTVTTGTAGATLTPDGTDAWTLDLVLPSAGANGVDTAAIQDSAVTSAKIADGTIVDADINAAAAIAATKISGTALVASTVDAKGDLYVGTAADTVARLAVGSNGALLVADSTQTAGVRWTTARRLEGTGAPEGVVTAPPGSTFLQTDSTVDVKGWIRWIKATGTGNTGWIAGPEADTGWRTGLTLENSWANSGGGVYVRRIGKVVHFVASNNLEGASATAATVWTAPDGFRCTTMSSGALPIAFHEAGEFRAVQVTSAGAVTIRNYNTATSKVWRPAVSWVTDNAWPSSLPGTAA